ncbi:MAG: hypothetical protein IPL06_20005 [Betaproteobacteria bacterium]|nr:hypothetical protein [Betaproteobacteria bacterium]
MQHGVDGLRDAHALSALRFDSLPVLGAAAEEQQAVGIDDQAGYTAAGR